MSNVVFILGAGCSKECGAPLMKDFLDVAFHLHNTRKIQDKDRHFEIIGKAIGALQSVHSKSQLDIINVESVFNAFELAKTIERLPGFEAGEIPSVVDALKEVIVATLQSTIKFPTKGQYIVAPHPYSDFATLVKRIKYEADPMRTVSILTFNYDIAVDMALYQASLGPDYCLDQSTSPSSVPLLKLHGSLNWASRSEDGNVITLTMEKYLQKYHYSGMRDVDVCSIPIGNHLQEYFSNYDKIEVKPEPVIVPPTWNKAEHHNHLRKVWSRAAEELGEAEHIFIIGYSLPITDVFFPLLYALGTVGQKPLKRIEVFNPENSGETEKKFESIMGPGAMARFKYTPTQFSHSIGVIDNYFPSRQR